MLRHDNPSANKKTSTVLPEATAKYKINSAGGGSYIRAIIPMEDVTAEALGVLNGAEPFWELRLTFHRFEVALRERIVVRGVWPTIRLGHTEVSEQKHGCFGPHGRAAVGVQGQLLRANGMLGERVLEQRLEQVCTFRVCHTPRPLS